MKEFTITLPIYHQVSKKKTILLGLNWAINAHYRQYNNVKKAFTSCVVGILESEGLIPEEAYSGRYTVGVKIWWKNCLSDIDNIGGMVTKLYADSLQSACVVSSDNFKHFAAYSVSEAGQDKENPRAVITFTPTPSD